MKGLELAKRYWEECAREIFEKDFPEMLKKTAVGLCGSGSECLGYDDEISRDHDFEPGFCLFLPGEEEVSRRDAFLLERAYAKLPKEYGGFARAKISPAGGSRHGVIRLSEFLTEKLGVPDGRLSLSGWLTVPEQGLLEVTGGKIWRDDSGVFTALREDLSRMPEDILLRKLSGELLIMHQSGQYNFPRCLDHGERAAAMLALSEFVRSAAHVLFLLSGAFMPYYKWVFRALRNLGGDRVHQADALESLLFWNGEDPLDAGILVAELAEQIAEELRDAGRSDAICANLQDHAYSVEDHIADPQLRHLHILSGVHDGG